MKTNPQAASVNHSTNPSEGAYLRDIEKLTGVRLTVVEDGLVDMPLRDGETSGLPPKPGARGSQKKRRRRRGGQNSSLGEARAAAKAA